MSEALTVNLLPRISPDPPVELVCILSNHASVLGHRLIVRKGFAGDERDYHLAIDRRLARFIDDLFDSRPFRKLRRDPLDRVAISYKGIADPERSEVYLLLTHGRSRLKVRMRVPTFIMMELAWVAALDAHDPELARMVVEA